MINKIGLLFLGLGLLVSTSFFFGFLENSDEIQSKREWSILQELEKDYRGKENDNRIIVKKRHGYDAVGVISVKNNTRVWILLNSKYHPLIKELPSQDYQILPAELEYILSEAEVNEVVKNRLYGSVSRQ